jgi:hypothetical protein
MKKLLTLIGLMLLTFNLFSQNIEVDELTLRDSMTLYNNGIQSTLMRPNGDGTVNIKNVSDPVADQDAATKKYVDDNVFAQPLDSLFLNRNAITTGHNPYKVDVDTINGVLRFYNDEVDIAMQMGQELWLKIKNNNGSTFANGILVYISGSSSGFPTVSIAHNRDFMTADAIGMLTHSVESGTFGFLTTYGTVGSLTTTGETEGARVYVDTLQGGKNWTTTIPIFPNFQYEIGFIHTVDNDSGKIFINPKGQIDDIMHNINNANIVENFDFTSASNGTTITGTLESSDGKDYLTVRWSDGFSKISVPTTVTIPPGTNNNSQVSYIYIPQSTGNLTASTSYFPIGTQYKSIAKTDAWSAARTQTNGLKGIQNYNDYVANTTTMRGRIAQIGNWQRLRNLKYINGSNGTVTVRPASGLADTVTYAIGQGNWSQANEQVLDAMDMFIGDSIYVLNYPDHPDTAIIDLNEVLIDATGSSLAGRAWTWVFWISQNKTGEPSHMWVNLPNGSYSNGADAEADVSGFKVTEIPYTMRSFSGFTTETVMTHSNPSGGTWSVFSTTNIQGNEPGYAGGGGSAGVAGTWDGLTDTPASKAGSANKLIGVGSGEANLEYKNVEVDGSGNMTVTGWTLTDSLSVTNGATIGGDIQLQTTKGIYFRSTFEGIRGTAGGDLVIDVGGTNSNRMFFDNAGNIGVDEINPSAKFDINGNLRVQDGNILTSAATGNLFAVTPTTINIGKASSTVNIGNDLVAAGDITGNNLANTNTGDVTLNASATTGGMSIIGQDISNRAATNAQTGYMTSTLVSNIETNNAKVSNVTTNLSEGTTTTTTVDVNSSDGTNATLQPASTSRAGVMSKAKFDEVVANTSSANPTLDDVLTNGNTSAQDMTVGNMDVDGGVINVGESATTTGEITLFTSAGNATTTLRNNAANPELDINSTADRTFNMFNSGTGILNATLDGKFTVAGDIAANSGNLTTTSATASLYTSNATDINIGSGSSTVNIGNDAVISGDSLIILGKTLRFEDEGEAATTGNVQNEILFRTNDVSSGAQHKPAAIKIISESATGKTFRFGIFTASGDETEEERLSIDNTGNTTLTGTLTVDEVINVDGIGDNIFAGLVKALNSGVVTNTKGFMVENTTANEEYMIIAGVPGVSSNGFSIYDKTNLESRIVIRNNGVVLVGLNVPVGSELFGVDGDGYFNGDLDLSGIYKIGGTELKLNPFKVGSLGALNTILTGAGITADATWATSLDLSGGGTFGGILTADAFRSNSDNVDYNLLARNFVTAPALHVQQGAVSTSSTNTIARFRYGSMAVNGGTLVMEVNAGGVDVTGIITGGNVTSEANPGHTHTSISISGLDVASGGTGNSTLTSNSLLTGNGTSAIVAESELTYDGDTLEIEGSVKITGFNEKLILTNEVDGYLELKNIGEGDFGIFTGDTGPDNLMMDFNDGVSVSVFEEFKMERAVAAQIRITTASTTLDATDYSLIITGGATVTITLPSAVSATGRIYNITNQASIATITSYINQVGVASTSIPTGSIISIQSDGTNWYMIGR